MSPSSAKWVDPLMANTACICMKLTEFFNSLVPPFAPCCVLTLHHKRITCFPLKKSGGRIDFSGLCSCCGSPMSHSPRRARVSRTRQNHPIILPCTEHNSLPIRKSQTPNCKPVSAYFSPTGVPLIHDWEFTVGSWFSCGITIHLK